MVDANWKCAKYNELPFWMRHNDCILTSYRPSLQSFQLCLHSMLRLHYDTGNIWTHFIPGVLYTILTVHLYVCDPYKYKYKERVFVLMYYCSCIICFMVSTTFHIFSCHSQKIAKVLGKCDYFGISLLIVNSYVPVVYYAFYRQKEYGMFYISLFVLLAVFAFIVSLFDKFDEPELRWLRAGIFLTMGLSGVIPAVHIICSEGWEVVIEIQFIRYSLLMGSSYVSAAFIYIFRIPERFIPEMFDFWFHSHQIFHVLTVLGSVIHCRLLTALVDFRTKLKEVNC